MTNFNVFLKNMTIFNVYSKTK